MKVIHALSIMWVFNLIAFITCLLVQDYALANNLWYLNTFVVLSVGFGISKAVISSILIVNICDSGLRGKTM